MYVNALKHVSVVVSVMITMPHTFERHVRRLSVLVVGHAQCSEEREEEDSVAAHVHRPHGPQAIPDIPELQGRRKEGTHHIQ